MGKVPLPTRRLIEFHLQVAAAKGDRALGRGPVERLSPTVHQGMVSSRPGHQIPVGPIVPKERNVQVPNPA